MQKKRHCEVCGKELRRPQARPVCADCSAQMGHSLADERRRRRLDRCGHVAFELGRNESGMMLEYHVRGKEMEEVARCRRECGLPAVWDGRRWVKGEGLNADGAEGAKDRREGQGGDEGTTEDTDDTERDWDD